MVQIKAATHNQRPGLFYVSDVFRVLEWPVVEQRDAEPAVSPGSLGQK